MPKVDFNTSPDIDLTPSTGLNIPFDAGFNIIMEATGEYGAVFLPPAQETLHEIKGKPVLRGSRESVAGRGFEIYGYQEKGVGQGVVSVSSSHDTNAGAQTQPQGITDIVVEAEPHTFTESGTRPARRLWKRFSGWCERRREDADGLLNGPWY